MFLQKGLIRQTQSKTKKKKIDSQLGFFEMFVFLFTVKDDDEWIYLSKESLDQWIHRRLFHPYSCH